MKPSDAPASHLESESVPDPAPSPETASASTPSEITLEATDTAETMAPVAAATVTAAIPIEPAVAPAASHAVPRTASIRRSPPFRTVALVGVTAILLAAVAFPRRPEAPAGAASDGLPAQSEQAASMAASGQPVRHAPTASGSPAASSASVAPRAVRESSKKGAASKTTPTRSGDAAKSTAPSAAVAAAPVTEDAAAKPAEPESKPVEPAAAVASTERSGLAPVTITGCLEMSVSQDEFRLTETDGVDAPKARSWRTGFLRKRSTPVALVELSDPQALHPQVGKRVAATGLLTSRELRVNSLRVVGPCN